jgi:hypothetical protein
MLLLILRKHFNRLEMIFICWMVRIGFGLIFLLWVNSFKYPDDGGWHHCLVLMCFFQLHLVLLILSGCIVIIVFTHGLLSYHCWLKIFLHVYNHATVSLGIHLRRFTQWLQRPLLIYHVPNRLIICGFLVIIWLHRIVGLTCQRLHHIILVAGCHTCRVILLWVPIVNTRLILENRTLADELLGLLLFSL